MSFYDIWFRLKTLPKEKMRSLVDDAQCVSRGSSQPQASSAARILLQVVQQLHPDLI